MNTVSLVYDEGGDIQVIFPGPIFAVKWIKATTGKSLYESKAIFDEHRILHSDGKVTVMASLKYAHVRLEYY